MSVAFGAAGGVLIATVAFELFPRARELATLLHVALGFAGGFAAVYALDLFLNRGQVAGPRAAERRKVASFHARRRPRGKQVMVLAWGTTAEEVIEGVAIGVAIAVGGDVGVLLGLAIAVDNVTEAFSVGALIRDEAGRGKSTGSLTRSIMTWSSAPGVAVFLSAWLGWLAFAGLPDPVLATLLAIGAGCLFYLTVTDFIPEAEERQYQQSAALAAAVGFVAMYALSVKL
jgi:ZIP family zinc transporter